MARYTKTEQADAAKRLKEIIKPGDTVKTILRHCSRSGMSRSISPVVDGSDVSWLVARALGDTIDQNNGGIKMGGCGMDMGFALIYNLSSTIYPAYKCTGDGNKRRKHRRGCPSNAHVNDHTIARDGRMMHHDGYALRQEWL